LVRLLSSIEPGLKILHLCGEDRVNADGRESLTQIVVYRAKAIQEQPDLRPAEGAVVLVHSSRAGRRLAALIEDRSSIAVAAVSNVAAEAVGGGWETVAYAEKPTDEALLALAARLCNKSPPE
jgi:uroporphyrinogen-III synthase